MIDRIEILQLIAARSRAAAHAAAGAIKAVRQDSPMAARRCAMAAEQALDDTTATFSPEERLLLATLLGAPLLEHVRGLDIRLRVSKSEKAQVQQAADEAGLSVSNYIRRCVGLPLVD